MARIEIREVIKALASTKEGCKEFDAWIEMVMYPNRHYLFVEGNYYKEKVAISRNLLKCTLDYTTSLEDALFLLPPYGWEYDVRITHKFGEVIVNTGHEIYSCRAPDAALGLCYVMMQIAEKEGYCKDKKGPAILSEFFSKREYLKNKMKLREETKKRMAATFKQRSARMQKMWAEKR